MRLLRSTFTATLAIGLLAGSAVSASAQEASPEPTVSPSPVPLAVEPVSEPLPVADYWSEWAEHKTASRGRVDLHLNNARYARSKKVRFHQQALAAYGDELAWLANHQPQDCYADEYEQWRAAVHDLRSNAKKAVQSVGANKNTALKRIAKQRSAAVKRLDKATSNLAGCGPSALVIEDTVSPGESFAGTWKSGDDMVMQDGFHNSSRLTLAIEPDGRYVARDSNAGGCRLNGHGYVPATLTGKGEFRSDSVPVFIGENARSFCYPRGGKPRVRMPWDTVGEFRYDAAHDVVYRDQWGYCFWRKESGGSPKDCKAFWRGTPAKTSTADDSSEEAAAPEEEATASPDPVEG